MKTRFSHALIAPSKETKTAVWTQLKLAKLQLHRTHEWYRRYSCNGRRDVDT
jgi:hypothetical protein